jgi:hypothetical protein
MSREKFVELHSCGLTQQYIEGSSKWDSTLDAAAHQRSGQAHRQIRDKLALNRQHPGHQRGEDEAEARELARKFVDTYAPRGRSSRVRFRTGRKVKNTALEELYNYSKRVLNSKK